MKANIISLTSLPGSMKDVQFQFKKCFFFMFLCFEQFPVWLHLLFQCPAGGSTGGCQTPDWCGASGTHAGAARAGKAFLGEGCEGPDSPLNALPPAFFSIWVSMTGLGLME